MVRSVAGNLPEQVKNNQSVNTAAGNGGQKMSQYSWFTVYVHPLEQPYQKEFLQKREELRSLATEIRLIFKSPVNELYGKFVECYEVTLFRMY